MARSPAPEGEPTGVLPVLTSVIERRWTSSVFGIVAEGSVRRRPSDIARALTATLVVGLAAAGAQVGTDLEKAVVSFLEGLPGSLGDFFRVVYAAGAVVAGVLVVTALVARRVRLLGTLVLAGGLAWLLSTWLSAVVDLPASLVHAGAALHGYQPDFPVVPLAAIAAVILAARPYLTRPARRLLEVVFWFSALSALALAAGLPTAVLASLVLGWGTAALAHVAFGSPAATPSQRQVAGSLRELGVEPDGLQLDPFQTWGRTRYHAGEDGRLGIEVVGRDGTDARLFAKLWRFVWYKDSGPTLSLTREHQVEHEAYVLLLAQRSGARLPDVVAAGVAGARDDAVLVVRDPGGRPLTDLGADELTDAVLDDAWDNLGRLHRARIAHGNTSAGNTRLADDGTTGFVDLTNAVTSASVERTRLDQVQLLATTAVLIGDERALAAAERSVGTEALTDLLPLLQPAALTGLARREVGDVKEVLARLREAGAALTGTEAAKPAALRRFSLGSILLAGAFAFGLYLLVGELVGVAEMGDIFSGAIWGWVALTAVLAVMPPFPQSVAMLGSVSTTLPLGPVVAVQYAQAFTGLVGGTAGNATLSIRFFQKRGLPPAVAVSSGVLNSAAGFITQAILVVVGLAVTGMSYGVGPEDSSSDSGLPTWLIILIVVIVFAVILGVAVPRFRHRIKDVVAGQLKEAYTNLRGILSTPRKAVELFGGNLVSQIIFGLVLGAALHAYGQSLPLMQLIVINSFASFIGGAAPVPGGMGVVEAGLIAGFTAAGIPQAEAVAATFTARMFTSYLSPIWGWMSFNWLRKHDYV
jgi:uncharacterized membrane protein YbhN (UPF0104 family)/tRNA A-37 threonylcarbamoyl transferase component Bud32